MFQKPLMLDRHVHLVSWNIPLLSICCRKRFLETRYMAVCVAHVCPNSGRPLGLFFQTLGSRDHLGSTHWSQDGNRRSPRQSQDHLVHWAARLCRSFLLGVLKHSMERCLAASQFGRAFLTPSCATSLEPLAQGDFHFRTTWCSKHL